MEHPEGLWRFLSERRFGEHLSGTVAAIESFGVFVSLDDGPDHPIFPGVGFITYPELSWRHFDSPTDIVQVGQRVTCAFLQHDTWNAEARLSLRALQPDPLQEFADTYAVGATLHGRVTRLLPFGAFVELTNSLEGLIHQRDLTADLHPGDELPVTLAEIDHPRRRVLLTPAGPPPTRPPQWAPRTAPSSD